MSFLWFLILAIWVFSTKGSSVCWIFSKYHFFIYFSLLFFSYLISFISTVIFIIFSLCACFRFSVLFLFHFLRQKVEIFLLFLILLFIAIKISQIITLESSHKYIVFSFSFNIRYFLISLEFYSLTYWLFRSALFNFHRTYFSSWFLIYFHVGGEHSLCDFNPKSMRLFKA